MWPSYENMIWLPIYTVSRSHTTNAIYKLSVNLFFTVTKSLAYNMPTQRTWNGHKSAMLIDV